MMGVFNGKETWQELSYQEVSKIYGAGGAAPKSYILDKLSDRKWNLKNNTVIVVEVNTSSKSTYDWCKRARNFLIPQWQANFISGLFDLSLTHNILFMEVPESKIMDVYSNTIYLEQSKDGTSNIDDEVVQAFVDACDRVALPW